MKKVEKEETVESIEPQGFDAELWCEPLRVYEEIGGVKAREVNGKILIENIVETETGDKKMLPIKTYDTWPEARAFLAGVNWYWEANHSIVPTVR